MIINYGKISIYVLHLKFGGIESAVCDLANILIDNFDIEIVSFYNYGHPSFKLDDRVKIVYLTNLRANRVELLNALKNPFQITTLLRQLIISSKIIYLKNTKIKKNITTNSSGILISSRISFHKAISNAGDARIKICQEHSDHNESVRYIRNLMRSVKDADYLMPVSQTLTNEYSLIAKPDCVYIRHAVQIPCAIEYNPSNKRLISIGRIVNEKGFKSLIEVFRLIHFIDRTYTLDILGDGVERKSIESLIEKYGLTNSVKLHGFVGKEAVVAMLKKASLFVTCTKEESFGLVIIESFSQGVPVVAFDGARGVVEILSNDTRSGRLIPDGDINSMANCILTLTTHDMKIMSKYAYNVATLYDRQKVKKEYENFFKKAVSLKAKKVREKQVSMIK